MRHGPQNFVSGIIQKLQNEGARVHANRDSPNLFLLTDYLLAKIFTEALLSMFLWNIRSAKQILRTRLGSFCRALARTF